MKWLGGQHERDSWVASKELNTYVADGDGGMMVSVAGSGE
jgi:hypothetical protein